MSAITRRNLLRFTGITIAGSATSATARARKSRSLQQTTEWPQFQFDNANSGYAPDVSGPTKGVAVEWVNRLNDGNDTSPAVADGRVYSGAWDGTIHAQDIETGEQIWERQIGKSTVYHTPAVADGTLYAGTGDGTVYALDAAEGTPRWSFDPDSKRAIRASPLVVGDTVYVPSGDGHVYALRGIDGRERWRFKPDVEKGVVGFQSSAAFADDSLYVGGGHVLETPQTDGGGNLFENKEQIEAMNGEGFVHALDPSDGTERWRATLDHFVTSATTVSDGTVYVGGWDRTVRAFDTGDGNERWRFNTKEVVHSTPAIANGTLFVADWSGQVYALSADDGSVKWRFAAGGAVQTSLAVADGTVYVGSDDSRLYAINAEDGSERWRFTTNGINVWAPAVANGHVYICDGDGRVIAVKEGDSTTASIAGPKSQSTTTAEPSASTSTSTTAGADTTADQAGTASGSVSASNEQRQRGFFSNSGDEPEFLSNVFNLTVLGFLLSVVGIIHQMIQGR